MRPPQTVPPDRGQSPPITIYAVILGVLVFGAIVFGTQYGRAMQNATPSGAPTSAASGSR